LEFAPDVGSFQTSETEHRLSAAGGPAHAGSLKAVFDKMATGAFNHTRCNRKAGCHIFVTLHAICVRRGIAARCIHVDAFLFGQLLNRRCATQSADNTVSVAPQNPQQVISNELVLGCLTPNQNLRCFPDVPRNMHDTRNIDHIISAAVAQTRICIQPQTVLTVHQTHQQHRHCQERRSDLAAGRMQALRPPRLGL